MQFKAGSSDYAEPSVTSQKFSDDPNHTSLLRYTESNTQPYLQKFFCIWTNSKHDTIEKYCMKTNSKQKASTAVTKAIKDGQLQRKPCCICGNIKAEAHHENYERELDVIWLCRLHHMRLHRSPHKMTSKQLTVALGKIMKQVGLKEDVDEAIEKHLKKLRPQPSKQGFIDSLLRLALTVKRIPIIGQTSEKLDKKKSN